MDPITLAVGAGIFLAGSLVGWAAAGHRRRQATTGASQPICGCGHHRSMHEDGTGRCRAEVLRRDWVTGSTYVRCTCRGYVGPEPLASVWAPPMLTEDDER